MIATQNLPEVQDNAQTINLESTLSKEYEMPANKTCRFVIFPALYTLSAENRKNALNYFAHAKDGNEFKITITFEAKDENVQLLINCKAQSECLDQSKIYKLSSTIFCQKTKKQKDIKIETNKENIIKIPITAKLKDKEICLMNEISIEISPKYSSRDEVGFTGIINNAATCYMNSVFQILFHLGIFQKLIYSIQSNQYNQFPCTLQTLFYNLRTSKTAISTQDIIKSFKWDIEQQAIQQDVQEFIMELLKALSTKASEIKDDIDQLFQGILENHIRNENFDNSNQEEFMDISLNITNSLTQSLNMFTEHEILEAYTHDEFGKQEAVKYHKFKKLPPILLINLKRYQYDGQGFAKIHDSFQYTNQMNFKDYLINQEDSYYDLYAVLVHRGEAINHGHYYCFIKPFYQSQQWFKFDDKIVTRATQKEVFENNFGGFYQKAEYNNDLGQIITEEKNNPETAYMLVYIKKNTPQILEAPNDFPNWILEQEIKLNALKHEQKNFVQTNLFTVQHLNQNVNTTFRIGLIFHKKAQNQSIDLNAVEEFFAQYTTPFLVPKTITVQQMIDQLSEKINVNKQNLHLLIYRISHSKPNLESLQYMQPSKMVSFFIASKLYQWGIMVISTDEQDQLKINDYLGVEQIKLEIPQLQNGKSSKDNKFNESKQIVIFKTHNDNEIEFQKIQLFERDQNLLEKLQPLLFPQDDSVTLIQNDGLEFKHLDIFKNSEYLQIYTDKTKNLMTKMLTIYDMREIIIKVISENQCTSQIFHKTQTTQNLLDYIAQIEDCNQENIQIKYKDKKGNQIQLQKLMTIEELTSVDNHISYKQTIIPVGAMKEQFSFQLENQQFIIQKSMSFAEFMEQENYVGQLPLLISKKDKKAAWILLDLSSKISRAVIKNDVKFVKPIILGTGIYLVCFIQSVEIIQLCTPIVIQIATTTTVSEVTSAIIQHLSLNSIKYKTQQIQITEDCIYSQEDDKQQKLDLQLRIKINNQEISQEIQMQINTLAQDEKQLTLVMTFMTIRDTKTDKLRQKGVQIL